MTVLLVEDDPDQLAIRAMLFRQSGFEVSESASCLTAVNIAIESNPDCVVLDLRLPTEQDGLRLLHKLKIINPTVRIYVLTGQPNALASWPDLALAEEVFGKGQSIAPLLRRLKSLQTKCQEV